MQTGRVSHVPYVVRMFRDNIRDETVWGSVIYVIRRALGRPAQIVYFDTAMSVCLRANR